MASAQVVETSVANNSPSKDSSHPDGEGMLLLGSKYFLMKEKSSTPSSRVVDIKLLRWSFSTVKFFIGLRSYELSW